RNPDVAFLVNAHVGRVVEGPGGPDDAVADRHAAAGSSLAGEAVVPGQTRAGGLAGFRLVTGIRVLAALAEAQAVAAALVELEHELRLTVDEVEAVVRRDADAVGVHKDLLAPVVEEVSLLVEDPIRVLGASKDVDIIFGVGRHGADLTPFAALGHLSP